MRPRTRETIAVASLGVTWLATRRHVIAGDLGLSEETAYLRAGLELLHRGHLPASLGSSPLYAVWYAGIAAAVRDPVATYYAQWLLADFLLAGAMYAAARTRLDPVAAALATSFFVSLDAIAGGSPRVYHLALAIALFGAAIEPRVRGGRAWAAVALGACGLVRPEYVLALLALGVLAATARLDARRRAAAVGGLALAAASVPFAARLGDGRLWRAFDAPATLVGALTQATWLRDIAPALALLALIARAGKGDGHGTPPRLVLVACAAALPSLLVQPTAAQLLPCIAAIVLAAAGRLGEMAACTLAVLPITALLAGPPARATEDVRRFVFALQGVWEAAPAAHRRMLEADGGYCTYLDVERCETVAPADKPTGETFAAFVARRGIDAVVVSPRFLHLTDYKDDATLAAFVQSPHELGFTKALEQGRRTLFLRDAQEGGP